VKPITLAVAIIGLTLTVPATAAPGDMNVATFLAKANALKAKGFTAMFSSDIGLLKSEAMAAGQAYKARLMQERASGRPSSCPPQGTKVGSGHFMAHLESYPVASRQSTSLKTAIADMFSKRFPCPK
jgi:hypothetical protein